MPQRENLLVQTLTEMNSNTINFGRLSRICKLDVTKVDAFVYFGRERTFLLSFFFSTLYFLFCDKGMRRDHVFSYKAKGKSPTPNVSLVQNEGQADN